MTAGAEPEPLQVVTRQDPHDLKMRFRFLIGQYGEDASNAVRSAQARACSLREAGALTAAGAAEETVTALKAAAVANRSTLTSLLTAENFERVRSADAADETANGSARGGALYDSGVQVLRCLARDWCEACGAVRAQSLGPVLQRLEAYFGEGAGDDAGGGQTTRRVLVPGCGMGRLALELAARLGPGATVVANDESAAMLAGLASLIVRQPSEPLVLHPALDAAASGLRGASERLAPVEVDLGGDLLASAGRLVLDHGDFTQTIASSGGGIFDAVATLFVLDCVSSLPDAVRAVATALRPGGLWVNCGPLRRHRSAPPWCFEDIPALAEACGLEVEEDTRFPDCEYLPRTVTLGVREVYDAQLFVARKPPGVEQADGGVGP